MREPGVVADEGFGPSFSDDYIKGFAAGRQYQRDKLNNIIRNLVEFLNYGNNS